MTVSATAQKPRSEDLIKETANAYLVSRSVPASYFLETAKSLASKADDAWNSRNGKAEREFAAQYVVKGLSANQTVITIGHSRRYEREAWANEQSKLTDTTSHWLAASQMANLLDEAHTNYRSAIVRDLLDGKIERRTVQAALGTLKDSSEMRLFSYSKEEELVKARVVTAGRDFGELKDYTTKIIGRTTAKLHKIADPRSENLLEVVNEMLKTNITQQMLDGAAAKKTEPTQNVFG